MSTTLVTMPTVATARRPRRAPRPTWGALVEREPAWPRYSNEIEALP